MFLALSVVAHTGHAKHHVRSCPRVTNTRFIRFWLRQTCPYCCPDRRYGLRRLFDVTGLATQEASSFTGSRTSVASWLSCVAAVSPSSSPIHAVPPTRAQLSRKRVASRSSILREGCIARPDPPFQLRVVSIARSEPRSRILEGDKWFVRFGLRPSRRG